MTDAIRRHRGWTTLGLALPLVVGGWLALLFGAWDYLPWLTSPAVIAGLAVTLIGGLRLQRRGAIRTRQIGLAVLLGGVGFPEPHRPVTRRLGDLVSTLGGPVSK